MKYLTQDERLDVLLTLKHTVKEHDCKLTHEIVELIDREADLLMRGVKENNLEGENSKSQNTFCAVILARKIVRCKFKIYRYPKTTSGLNKFKARLIHRWNWNLVRFCGGRKTYELGKKSLNQGRLRHSHLMLRKITEEMFAVSPRCVTNVSLLCKSREHNCAQSHTMLSICYPRFETNLFPSRSS